MVWIWGTPVESNNWGAELDYDQSPGVRGIENLSHSPVSTTLRPVFVSRTGLKKFKQLHCPPIGIMQTVDKLWKSIILNYVPHDRVQFLPIRLIARGEIFDEFMWVIPFDRVFSIDKRRSIITNQLIKEGRTMIFGAQSIVFNPDCLGSLHLARDEEMPTQLLVSDELQKALSGTGENSPFREAALAPTH